LILIVSAAALRIAQDGPEPRASGSVYDGLKSKLFLSPSTCPTYAMKMFRGLEGVLSENQTSRIQGVFRNFERQNNLMFLTVGTKHTICMADNWFVHALEATAKPSLFVYVALDETSYLSCVNDIQSRAGAGKIKHTIECVDLSDFLPWSDLNPQSAIKLGSCVYKIITWTKPLLLKVATSSVPNPSSVLLIDFDVIIHGDVQTLLNTKKKKGWMPIFQAGNNGKGLPNTGFVSINSNAKELLHMWLKYAPIVYDAGDADQAGLHSFLSSAQGKHFKEEMFLIPKYLLGMCGERGRYATHYTCVPNKYEAMQHDGNYRPASQGCTDSVNATSQLARVSTFNQELEDLFQTSCRSLPGCEMF